MTDVVALQQHTPGERRLHPRQRSHQRAFACAVGTEQAHEFTRAQFE
jgi:hypothetical protein